MSGRADADVDVEVDEPVAAAIRPCGPVAGRFGAEVIGSLGIGGHDPDPGESASAAVSRSAWPWAVRPDRAP